MKTAIIKRVLLLSLVAIPSLLTCCSDDTDKATSGVWYLQSYNDNNCNWGEFLAFEGNQMVWGLRDRGTSSSTFTYSCTGAKIKCKCTSGDDDITFTVETVSSSNMTTTSTDGIKRYWKR